MGIADIVEEQAVEGRLQGDFAAMATAPGAQAVADQTGQVDIEEEDEGVRVRFDPVLSFEKTDVQFWASIIQTVLLAYIALRISRL